MNINLEDSITIEEVREIALGKEHVYLDKEVDQAIVNSRARVNQLIKNGKPVYGVNTGFGIFANKKIDLEQISILNRNLILSHAVGIGDPLPDEIVRAAMFIRAVSLSKGFSGVRPEIVKTLLDMLNNQVTPIIPSKGSLGSSGDLCQLSHLALVLSKDVRDLDEESGKAKFKGQECSGKEAMAKAGIERSILSAKEGLALNNGATFTAAIAALSVSEAEYLLQIAETSAALAMEALCARADPFDHRIQLVRNQKGQIETARNILKLIKGSSYINSVDQVQDAYSIRCIPQVHGAVRDSVGYVKKVVEREINAVTDNPLIFETGEAISGGNFHGEPLGLGMDFLAVALCELGAISERRINLMLDAKFNHGLTQMLVDDSSSEGLNSGLMMPHYTAASLVLENQTLATPDSIRSLPTSAGQEDHNANAMTAARHAYEIINNLRQILSIEIYTAVRAIDLRKRQSQLSLGKGTGKIYAQIKNMIQYFSEDTLWGREIGYINDIIEQRKL